jgi:hypothetical protein
LVESGAVWPTDSSANEDACADGLSPGSSVGHVNGWAGSIGTFIDFKYRGSRNTYRGFTSAAHVLGINNEAMVELTPTRLRSNLGAFGTVTLVPVGTLVAAIVASTLGSIVGWRGLLAIGALPVVMALVAWRTVP